jgi:hypothetical protein
MKLLFGRMNGTLESGLARRAGDAFGRDEFCFGFGICGEPATTLCPSVEHGGSTDSLVQPLGWQVAHKSGFVVFDTHCDNTVPPAQVLQKTDIRGTSILSNLTWAADNKITFDVYFCPGTTVKMDVVATQLKAEGGGEQRLDGGYMGYNGQGIYGIAPNTDNFTWWFWR